MSKAQGAIDWFNGAPLTKFNGKSYSIHNHHIFPQAQLYRNGYDVDNLLHRSIINEIANRVFLTPDTNIEISDRLPEEYFPEVETRYPGALTKQFIPMDQSLWKLERFENFLQARRELIALKFNEFMASLISKPEIVHERPITEIIKLGESATLEFKSTLQWDVIQNKLNPALRKQVLKTIAAFLNSSGGTLVIGVEDNGDFFGLANDLSTIQNSTDKFMNLVSTLITENIGAEFAPFIKIRIEPIDGKQVCVVDVYQAPQPAFLKSEKGTELYIRFGPTSRLLDTEEAVNYINMNWT
jgi:hypothetical protein